MPCVAGQGGRNPVVHVDATQTTGQITAGLGNSPTFGCNVVNKTTEDLLAGGIRSPGASWTHSAIGQAHISRPLHQTQLVLRVVSKESLYNCMHLVVRVDCSVALHTLVTVPCRLLLGTGGKN